MFSDLVFRLRSLFRRKAVEKELDDEVRFHVEQLVERYVESGLPREEALRRARLAFGGIEQAKEECRDARGTNFIESLLQDLRFSFRMLRKSPGFTTVVILTLALGIGANTAIFSVVSGVLLKPLPFPRSDQLVAIQRVDLRTGERAKTLSYPDFTDLRAQSQSLEAAAAYDKGSVTLTGMGDPAHLTLGIFSADMFNVLRVPPIVGREFAAAEDKPGTHVVMLSYRLWKAKFGGAPKVTNKRIVLDGKAYVVAGVMPADFQFPLDSQPMDLWTTIAVDADSLAGRGSHFLQVIARLRSGATLAAANAETVEIGARLERQYQDTNGHWGMVLQAEMQDLVGNVRPALLMVVGAVGLLLLIACANAANLLLARAAGRHREMAIRASLGAGKGRIVRQLLTESVLLSLAAGMLGLFLAVWGTAIFTNLPAALRIPRLASAEVDLRVLAFTLAVSLLTGILFGLAPALHAARFNVFGSLREGGRTATEGTMHSRMRSFLVISQVSLAVVLLVGASLLIESMYDLLHQSPGFDPDGVLTFDLDLPDARYGKPEQSAEFFQQLLGRIRNVSGVKNASGVMPLPLSSYALRTAFEIEGKPMAEADLPLTQIRAVGLDYFQTMRIPLLAGREFTARDDRHAPNVIIINQMLARTFFPGENPIGKHIKPGMSAGKSDSMCEIVGIVGDVKHKNLWQAPDPESYVPYDQNPLGGMNIVVRSEGDPMRLLPAMRAQVLAMDAELPIYHEQRMDDYVEMSVAQRRLTSQLCSIFAGAGLLLAVVGLFGVMSYSVEQRIHEIGVRVAVGADKTDILRLIIREGMGMTFVGIGVGLVGTFVVSGILKSQLFGVSATDPLTFLGVALALALVALVACYLPAHRATRVDPMVALRYE